MFLQIFPHLKFFLIKPIGSFSASIECFSIVDYIWNLFKEERNNFISTGICLNYLIIKGKFGKIFSGIVMVEVIYKSMVLFLFQKMAKYNICRKVLTDQTVISEICFNYGHLLIVKINFRWLKYIFFVDYTFQKTTSVPLDPSL